MLFSKILRNGRGIVLLGLREPHLGTSMGKETIVGGRRRADTDTNAALPNGQIVSPQDSIKGTEVAQVSFKSNDTHVFWPLWSDNGVVAYQAQSREEAEKECLGFLRDHMMPFDVENAESLGFTSEKDKQNLPDGLSTGIVGPSVQLALDAKRDFHTWTKDVPKDIYFEYVANFANVNEPRTNWRPLFYDALMPIVEPLINVTGVGIPEVVDVVNDKLWGAFERKVYRKNSNHTEIYFKSGQTPLIYDPMSTLLYGYASCTGISIFLINALRAVGIPARLAGTNAWNGCIENGNHSWIEVYVAQVRQWFILEAKPAAGRLPKDWTKDSCQFWFCTPAKAHNTTYYAASLKNPTKNTLSSKEVKLDSTVRRIQMKADRENFEPHFPMAWDMRNKGVPGQNRTVFMHQLCSRCSD